MADAEGQEKTEKATGKKLQDGRDKGQVARSVELSSFVVFSTGLIMIFVAKEFIGGQLSYLSKEIFNTLDSLTLNKTVVQLYAIKIALFFFITLSPVFIGLILMAFVVNIAQVGYKFSGKALAPKLDKLNFFRGFKNIFGSARSAVEVAKSLSKFILIGLFTYTVIKSMIADSIFLPEYSIDAIINFMSDSAVSLIWKLSLVYAVFAAIDFIYQRYKFNKEMMMTKQEVKEEMRQSEGDPLVKSKIKSLQYAASRRRMMKEVPTADVIITNPTHYAIALKYNPAKKSSPMVIAKGVDELAQRIKKIAMEHNVPLHEDRELARSLYKMCDVGEEIPEVLYHAVAKVLAYIFSLKNKKKRKSIV